MKCYKISLIRSISNDEPLLKNNSNILILFLSLFFITFFNNIVVGVSSNEFSNNLQKINMNLLSKNDSFIIRYNESSDKSNLEIKFMKRNSTIIPAQITDKVDLDIKKLDIKLNKLTKIIENYEKLGNVTKEIKKSENKNKNKIKISNLVENKLFNSSLNVNSFNTDNVNDKF